MKTLRVLGLGEQIRISIYLKQWTVSAVINLVLFRCSWQHYNGIVQRAYIHKLLENFVFLHVELDSLNKDIRKWAGPTSPYKMSATRTEGKIMIKWHQNKIKFKRWTWYFFSFSYVSKTLIWPLINYIFGTIWDLGSYDLTNVFLCCYATSNKTWP